MSGSTSNEDVPTSGRNAIRRVIPGGLIVLGIVLSLMPRVGLLGESLWVDELHTAWVVNASWGQVQQRASEGNQTPWYFFALKSWVMLTGVSEWALRFPSLVATSLAAAGAALGVWWWTRRLLWAVAAAAVMSLDRNAVFFGTEARPYAFVMLANLGACMSGVQLLRISMEKRKDRRAPIGYLCGVGLCAAFSILMHVTSGLAIATTLAAILIAIWWQTGDRKMSVQLAAVGLLSIAGALFINLGYVSDVWARRGQWSAFGSAQDVIEIWDMWPWGVYGLLPICIILLRVLLGKVPKVDPARLTVALALVSSAIAGSIAAWLLAYAEVAPIWHRRFLIGLWPPLCLASVLIWSIAFGSTSGAAKPTKNYRSPVSISQVSGLCLLLVAMLFGQGTLERWSNGKFHWLERGERWRAAVEWLRAAEQSGEPIYVAAELLESAALRGDQWAPGADAVGQDYLLYPVQSIYRIEDAIPLGPLDSWESWLTESPPEAKVSWILVRKRSTVVSRRLRELFDSIDTNDDESAGWESELFRFGNVTVVALHRRRVD